MSKANVLKSKVFQTRNDIIMLRIDAKIIMWTKLHLIHFRHLSLTMKVKKKRSIHSIFYRLYCLKKAKFLTFRSTAGYTRFLASSISPLKFSSVETFFFSNAAQFLRLAQLNVPSHRVWTIKRIHIGIARRKKATTRTRSSAGLKRCQGDFSPKSRAFRTITFYWIDLSFPSLQPLPSTFLPPTSLSPFLALVSTISDRFRLFALLNRGKVRAEKAPQPLTMTMRREEEEARKIHKKMIKMTVKGRPGKTQTSHTKRR